MWRERLVEVRNVSVPAVRDSDSVEFGNTAVARKEDATRPDIRAALPRLMKAL